MEKHVYLVRHGESNSNADGIMRGEASVLSEKGKEQAKVVAERVERIGVDALVSSTYPRALQTAEAISARIGLPIEESGLFVERRKPSFEEGRSANDPEVRSVWEKMLEGYASDAAYRHSDEENYADLRGRAGEALAFLEQHPAERICVVSHGIFMRTLAGRALLDGEFTSKAYVRVFTAFGMSNTGITYLRFAEGKGWQLVTWNDSAHLG